MKTMKRIADRVLVIFEFERAIYQRSGVPVEWVGHPLLETMPPPEAAGSVVRRLGLAAGRPVVALLPGSRPNEVRAILPRLVDAGLLIARAVPDVQFVVARAPHVHDDLFGPLAALASSRAVVVEGQADAVLAAADVAVVASGTVTVQAALHECPMIVVYRLSPLTYRLGRPFVRVDTFAMANLVAGSRVVPELIQDAFTPRAVADLAVGLLQDPGSRERMRTDLRRVKAALGTPGASARAARAVIDVGSRPAGPRR